MSLETTKLVLMNQYNGVLQIPHRVWDNWPSFIGFGATDFLVNTFIEVIPALPGPTGTLLNYFLLGMRDVTKMVTWEVLKNGGTMSMKDPEKPDTVI